MSLENAILGFLDRGPMTGYDLKTRCFDEALGHVWSADQAQVYRTLERLERQGYVRPRLVPQRGKPDRRLFSITTRGRAALRDWLHTTVEATPLRDPLLVRFALAETLTDEELTLLLAAARDQYQARLDDLRAEVAAPSASPGIADARSAQLFRMTLSAAMASTRAAIDWIDDCTDRISRGLPVARPSDEGV